MKRVNMIMRKSLERVVPFKESLVFILRKIRTSALKESYIVIMYWNVCSQCSKSLQNALFNTKLPLLSKKNTKLPFFP